MTWILNVIPMGKPRQTQADRWKKRPVVVRYREQFCDVLREECKRVGLEELPESLAVRFYIPMHTSWSKKKKAAMLGQPHKAKPDIDNLLKALLDALAEDDSYIWKVYAEKVWAETGSIRIKPL